MKWTEEQLKNLKSNCSYYFNNRKEAEYIFNRKWNNIYSKAHALKIVQKSTNNKCSVFLGCYVAERVLSHVFKDVEKMPNGNRGFDFICNKGKKIDVKSCCLHKNNVYSFKLSYNEIADYFLCIGFDNRENLNPQHIWLINSNDISTSYYKNKRTFREISSLVIKNIPKCLSLYSKYELTDKLKETIECCTELKSEHKSEVKSINETKKEEST